MTAMRNLRTLFVAFVLFHSVHRIETFIPPFLTSTLDCGLGRAGFSGLVTSRVLEVRTGVLGWRHCPRQHWERPSRRGVSMSGQEHNEVPRGRRVGTEIRRNIGIRLREHADHYAEEQENLDPGEKLMRAVKAFDGNGTFLCTGVLVRSPRNGGEDSEAWERSWQALMSARDCDEAQDSEDSPEDQHRDRSANSVCHDVWLCDSLEDGVGPNVQVQGALAVLDLLHLHHLKHSSGDEEFRVFADGDFASASRSAAQLRGFTFQVDDDGEEVLKFDSQHRGLEAYTAAVLADLALNSLPASILYKLTRRRTPLPLPLGAAAPPDETCVPEEAERGAEQRVGGRAWVPGWGDGWQGGFLGPNRGSGVGVQLERMRLGNWSGVVMAGLLGAGPGGARPRGFVDVEWAVRSGGDGEDGAGLPGLEGEWSMDKAVEVTRRRLRKYHIAPRALGSAEADDLLQALRAQTTRGAELVKDGQRAAWAEPESAKDPLIDTLQHRIEQLASTVLGEGELAVRQWMFVHGGGGGAAEAAVRASQGTAWAIVALEPHSAGSGGAFLQGGAHAASRQYVELEAGDMLMGGFGASHGVDAASGSRASLVLRFALKGEGDELASVPGLHAAAAAGDQEAQCCLAEAMERCGERAPSQPPLPPPTEQRAAVAWYQQSAAQGHPRALERLGTLLAEGAAHVRQPQLELPQAFEELLEGATAHSLWEIAARQGDAEAQARLAQAFRDGTADLTPDVRRAQLLFLLAAQQGHAGASLALAQLMLFDAQSQGVSAADPPQRSGGPAGGEARTGGGPRERVRVTGIKLKDGMPDTWCCGEYEETAESVHERTIYRKVGDSRFALWYDSIGMWRIGDRGDVGSEVGRASVDSDSMSPAGEHLGPWTVFVWSGREVGGEWTVQESVQAVAVGDEGVPGSRGTDWEPLPLGPEDVYEEGCFWLQEAAALGHPEAAALMQRMRLAPRR